jgi:hypothetical protein
MPNVVPSLRELARRAVPQALEAAVVPAVLYLLASNAFSARVAMVAPLGGVALACAFLGSVVLDRPLVRRFADDFFVLPGAVHARPEVHRCCRRLSIAWGAYGLGNAGLGLWMLTHRSTTAYVVARTPLSILGTASMVAVSALRFRRVVEAGPSRVLG